jgi:hypothetical protein
MNYQEAKSIRQKSYISYLTQKLSEGEGVGSAIKATISDKSKARSMGFKEKFDPLNIAKFVTGGSKFAPALLGSMMGRTQQDIQYFSGTKKAKDVGASATKIERMESDNNVLDVLSKIFTLLETTNKNDTLRKEKENNFAEEKELEREKRHKELIAAITGKKQPTTATPTAVKANDTGGLIATIMALVGGLIADAVKPIVAMIAEISSLIGDILKRIGIKAAETVLSAGKKLASLATGLAGAGGVVAGVVAGGAVLSAAATSVLSSEAAQPLKDAFKQENDPYGMLSAMSGDTGIASSIFNATAETDENAVQRKKVNLLANRPSDKKSLLFWKDSKLAADYLKDMGWDEKSGTTKEERSKGMIGVDAKGNPIMKPITPIETPNTETSTQVPTDKKAPAPQEKSEMKPVPEVSNKLNTLVNENKELNLPSKPESVAEAQVVNNTNINTTKSQKPKGPIPSVRNTESSFQRMLLGSLRVV